MRNINNLIKNSQFATVKYSGTSDLAKVQTITAESKKPNYVYIVSESITPIVLEYDIFFELSYCVPERTKYSITIHDPNHKILDKKDFPKGELSEEQTRLSRHMFKRLRDLYCFER